MTRKAYGLRSLGETVAELTRPIVGRRGFARGALIGDWVSIVGERLAASSLPERIAYAAKRSSEGTLHLRVATGGLAMELQHFEPILVERINAYFGYPAVARVKLIQGPLPTVARPRSPPPPRPRTLTVGQSSALEAQLADIADPDLRQALAELGRAVLARGEEEASHGEEGGETP